MIIDVALVLRAAQMTTCARLDAIAFRLALLAWLAVVSISSYLEPSWFVCHVEGDAFAAL